MLLLPQRYKFSSKSQLVACCPSVTSRCCCYRKGTNFQANHNQWFKDNNFDLVVVATAKVQIFKQITTHQPEHRLVFRLLLLPQRYKFSSKSQPGHHRPCRLLVVVATAKVQIFKQITTSIVTFLLMQSCCCSRKGTNFQANHNCY